MIAFVYFLIHDVFGLFARFMTKKAIARKAGGATTSPIAISIRILDVNDNAPRFPSFKPVFLQAGDSKKVVTQVSAILQSDS